MSLCLDSAINTTRTGGGVTWENDRDWAVMTAKKLLRKETVVQVADEA